MKYTPWTEKEEQILRQFYPVGGRNMAHRMLLAEGYKRSPIACQGKAKKLGLNAPGNGRFKPGQEPPNKGNGMSPETRAKVKHTWFKKGHKPHTTLYDGAIRTRKEYGTNIYYKYIRVEEGRWDLYHRWLWEQHHGPIPEGMVIRFIDGDQMNCTIENLEMVTMAENLNRNNDGETGVPGKRLTDNYVRYIIRRRFKMTDEDIDDNLIELYRQKLLLKRTIKNQES